MLQIGVDSYDKNIIMIHEDGKPFAFTRSKQNSELIAAIPDMLAALERAAEFFENDGYNVDEIRAVIAKAKGNLP